MDGEDTRYSADGTIELPNMKHHDLAATVLDCLVNQMAAMGENATNSDRENIDSKLMQITIQSKGQRASFRFHQSVDALNGLELWDSLSEWLMGQSVKAVSK
jgi:hypothetical protein